MNISPDIDALMWNIADSRDVDAAENFSKMFPDLSNELSKRMLLVQDIRQAKDLHIKPVPVPPFRPVQKVPLPGRTKWAAVAGFLLAGAALAFGAYAWQAYSAQPNSSSLQNCRNRPVPAIFQRLQLGGNLQSAPRQLSTQVNTGARPANSPSAKSLDNLAAKGNPERPAERLADSGGKPLHIALSQVPLGAALFAIGDQAKIEIEMAPNMPSVTIDAHYDQVDGISVLKDLGTKYGFEVVPDGEGKVLLIPKASVSNSQN